MNRTIIGVALTAFVFGVFLGALYSGHFRGASPAALPLVTTNVPVGSVNGTVEEIKDSTLTVGGGWMIEVGSGVPITHPSGEKAAVSDLKPGTAVDIHFKTPQKPGRISAAAVSSVSVIPAPPKTTPSGGAAQFPAPH
jgi:hypothetical protein